MKEKYNQVLPGIYYNSVHQARAKNIKWFNTEGILEC